MKKLMILILSGMLLLLSACAPSTGIKEAAELARVREAGDIISDLTEQEG